MSWLPDLKNLDFEKALQGAVAKVCVLVFIHLKVVAGVDVCLVQ